MTVVQATPSPSLPVAVAAGDRPAPAGRMSAVPRPVWRVILLSVGGAGVAAAGLGAAWVAFDGRALLAGGPARSRAIQIGPLADMPEIRNGVPALAPRPVRVIVANAAAPAAASASADGTALSIPIPPRAAADARALAATVAVAEFRADSVARTATPNAALASLTPPEPDRRPVAPPSGPAAVVPAPAGVSFKPASDAAVAGPPPVERASPSAASEQRPPLPPARPSLKAAAPPSDPAPSRSRPQVADAARSGAASQAGAAQPRQVAAPERAELFGVPMPSFVPTGRDIRDAATSIADTVVSIPGRF